MLFRSGAQLFHFALADQGRSFGTGAGLQKSTGGFGARGGRQFTQLVERVLCRDRAGPPGSAAGLPLDADQDSALAGGVRKRRGLTLRRLGVRRQTGRGTGRYAAGGGLRTASVGVGRPQGDNCRNGVFEN